MNTISKVNSFKSRRQFIKFLRLWDEGRIKKSDVLEWLKNTQKPYSLPERKG
jgi:hypothetical protein